MKRVVLPASLAQMPANENPLPINIASVNLSILYRRILPLIGFLLFCIAEFSYAQPSRIEGMWKTPGSYNSNLGTMAPRINNTLTFRGQTTGAGTNGSVLFNNSSFSYNPKWVAANGTAFTKNTRVTNGGVRNGATDIILTVAQNSYYTFNIGNSNAASNDLAILETTYNPTTFGANPTQSPVAASVLAGNNVIVTVTLSANPQSGEKVFVRYSNDNFASNFNVVEAAGFSGGVGTATIPGAFNTAGTTVSYYIFTTNVAAPAAANADYLALRIQTQSGETGSIWSYTVAAAAPTAQPTNLIFSAVDAGNMTVSWTAASPAPTGYIVLRSSGGTAPNTDPSNGTFPGAGATLGNATVVYQGTGVTTGVLSSLTDVTQYNYKVYSYNGSGAGTLYLTTSPLPGSQSTASVAAPTATAATLGATNFTANWGQMPAATGYRLDVSTANDFSSFVLGYNDLLVSGGATVSQSVTGLTSGATYYYRVRTIGTNSTSGNSNTITAVTLVPIVSTAAGGDWSTPGTWVGNVVPSAGSDVQIVSTATVTISSSITRTGATIVDAGGTLTATSTFITNGNVTINGTFKIGGTLSGGGSPVVTGTGTWTYSQTTGTLLFNANSTYNIDATTVIFWPSAAGSRPFNVTVQAVNNGNAVQLNNGVARTIDGTLRVAGSASNTAFLYVNGAGATFNVNGTLQIDIGGLFTNQSVTFGASSTLKFNTGTTFNYSGNGIWITGGTIGTVGVAHPFNVQISGNTILTMPNNAFNCAGSLTVDNGSTFNCPSANTFTVSGNVTNNGTLAQGTSSGGDMVVGGDWTKGSGATFTHNNRLLTFNKNGTQTIAAAGGTETFGLIALTNTSSLKLSSSPATSVTLAAANGLSLTAANTTTSVDLNGQTMTLSGGGNLNLGAGVRNIVGGGSSAFVFSGATTTITNGGTLAFSSNVTVRLSNGVDFGNTLSTINGIMQINNGGFVTNNAPTYGSSSTLIYNSGTNYVAGTEWYANLTSGPGIPQNVQIGTSAVNNSGLNFGTSTTYRLCNGNLTIGGASGSGYSFSLSTVASGDVKVGGNWNRYTNGTFTPNGRAVWFTGSAAQTISVTGGGTEVFNILILNNAAANVTISNTVGAITDVAINGAVEALQLLSAGSLDINGRTLYLSGTGGIKVSGGARSITGTSGTIAVQTVSKAVTSASGGTLSIGASILTDLTSGLDFGSGLTTINGTLQLSAGGFVFNNAPFYATGSLLKYNSATSPYVRGNEWNASSGAGYPYNVQVSNNTNVDPAGTTNAGTLLNIANNLVIDAGSGFYMDYGGHNMTVPLVVGKNATINGGFSASQASTGNVRIGGDWTVAASTVPINNNRAFFFDGTGTQTITKVGGGKIFFDFLRVEKTAGTLVISSSPATDVEINTSTAGNLLELNNTGALDLNGRSITLNGTGGNITVNAAGGTITSGVLGGRLVLSNTKTVNGAGTLTLAANVTTEVSAGVDFGAGKTTINGVLKLLPTGFVNTNAPIYGSASTLYYNTGDFSTNAEWAAGTTAGLAVPQNVTVDLTNSTNTLTLAANRTIPGTLTLIKGKLSVGANTLTINDGVPGGGTISGSASTSLVVAGTAGVLNFTSGAQTLKKLTLNSNSSATLGTSLLIAVGGSAADPGSVTVASGATLTTGGNLTLESNSTGSARVANSAGTISGDVTVQRFIPANTYRAWRLLSVPTGKTAGETIRQSWQANGTTQAGQGTLITQTAANGGAGFDATTPGNSMLTYNSTTNLWVGVPNTTAAIRTRNGYMLFVRGDRNAGINPTPGAQNSGGATTLSTKGDLYQGTESVTANAGYTIVGNLYASAVNFEALTRSGVDNNFTLWDPKISTANGLGGFATFSKVGGKWESSTNGGSYPNGPATDYKTIESGQAFFVYSAAGGTVTFNEAVKVQATTSSVFRPMSGATIAKLRSSLYAIGTDGSDNLADGNIVVFDDTYADAVDGDDALKVTNFGENLGVLRDTKTLAVEARSSVKSGDVIGFRMWNLNAATAYRLKFTPEELSTSGLTAMLEDKYLGTSKPVDLTTITYVDFTISAANPASYATDRFRVVFGGGTTVPVSFTTINAYEKAGKVQVEWKVAGERGIKTYDVERSADGRNFSKSGTVTASGNNGSAVSYNWLDAQPINGTNFYRIRSNDVSGQTKYTSIVKVQLGNKTPGFTVYPNPVKGGQLNLQFTGQAEGLYSIKVSNTLGQVLFAQSNRLAGGNGSQSIQLPAAISSGVYQLEITAPDNNKTTQKLIVE